MLRRRAAVVVEASARDDFRYGQAIGLEIDTRGLIARKREQSC
jgi:hypothetical protein